MNILKNPTPKKPDIKRQAARQLVEFTKNNFNSLLRQWETGMQLLWSDRVDEDGKPFGAKEMLALLGSDAGELFTISAGLRDYLEFLKPGCTLATLVKYYKPATIHPDGTVTLDAIPDEPV